MEKLKNNKVLNLVIEIILIIIIIILLIHSCNIQKKNNEDKNKKTPTGNVDIIEIKCDNTNTCSEISTKEETTKKSNNSTIITPTDKEEKPKEEEPLTGLVVVDNQTVKWDGKKDLKIFTNSAYELTDVISPESSNTYKFVVKNKTEYKLKYKITFIETNIENINMKYKLKKNDTYLVNEYTSYDNLIHVEKNIK